MELFSPVLYTSRLMLRPFQSGDAPMIFAHYAHDPEVTRHLTWNPHPCLAASEQFVAYKLAYQEAPRHYGWVIVLAGEVVGGIDLVNEHPLHGFEIGYVLGRAYWGKGYMSEAFHEVLRFFFSETDYLYCQMEAEVDNLASRRVIEKQGFHYLRDESKELPLKERTAQVAVYRLDKAEFVF